MKICGCTLRLWCSQVVPAFWAPMPMKSGANGILPCALGDLVLGASGTHDGGSTRVFQAGRAPPSPLSELRTETVEAVRQPFEESAEVLLLAGEGMPLCSLVSSL